MDAVKNTFYTLMLMSILLMGFTFIDLTGTVNYRVTETLYGGELIYLHSKNMILTGNSRINVPGTLPPLIMNVNGETQPTLTFQVNVTGNMKIIPHLYDWSFDGVNDYVEVQDVPSLSGLNEITVTAWAKANIITTNLQSIVTKWNWEGAQREWWLGIYRSYPNVGLFDEVTDASLPVRYTTPLNVRVGEWFFIAFSFDGVNYKLYLNDEVVKQGTWNGIIRDTTATIRMAIQVDNFWPFHGLIDEARIYNRTLSGIEISDDYNHVYNASGLVLYLDATFYSSSLGKYVDLSGNNNHGTPYGGVGRVVSSNRYAARLLNAASDNKAHFLIPEKHVYRILDASNNVLAEGVAEDISDVALDVNGTVTLQLTPPWNNMDLHYAYYGNPPTGEAESIILQHLNGTVYALFDASTYDGAAIYDVKNGLNATTQYISFIEASNPTLKIMRTGFLDDKYMWLHYLPIGTEIKIVYGQAQHTYIYNGTAIAFQLPEKPVKVKLNYYHADRKLYITLEKSMVSTPIPNMPIQVGSVINFINRLWGDAALIVPMLLPVSIYLKKRSLPLTAGSLALISAINMLLFPQSISIILLLASALLISLTLYTVIYG